MAKKKSDKETEPKKVSTKRFSAFLKNETTHFVIGLISVIFAVYLLLAFTSFFFTGAVSFPDCVGCTCGFGTGGARTDSILSTVSSLY